MNAASSGPEAWPRLPPTWKSDCAKPYRPPAAMRATLDASGWNTDEPIPIKAAEIRIIPYDVAWLIMRRPVSVKPMPITSE
jgi:hypothetical protein